MADVQGQLHELVRSHYGWALARLARHVRDLDLAEDALQQSLEAALLQWPLEGVPDAPRAWLIRTARNKAIDELRRRTLRSDKSEELVWLASLRQAAELSDDLPVLRDDMMRMLFTCCHPALSEETRVALTLKVVGGMTTEEIARAFVVPVPTMAQRLVRAKKKIRAANIPYAVPEQHELAERMSGVLQVVYLIFNEGYTATHGEALVRGELCSHAVRVGSALVELFPHDAECRGLYALMLLHDARRHARSSIDGELILLPDQDRSRWNHDQIARGCQELEHALRSGLAGPYCLQAAIAALHAQAPSHRDTDWPQIVGLYDRLLVRLPTAVVALNRAAAVAMAHSPAEALPLLDELTQPLADYYLYHAARADLLRRMGRFTEALACYGKALEHCHNASEQRFLRRRQVEVRTLMS